MEKIYNIPIRKTGMSNNDKANPYPFEQIDKAVIPPPLRNYLVHKVPPKETLPLITCICLAPS